ncbi:unnamed protein product [Brassica oleracea]
MAISTFQPMLLLLASLFFLPPLHAVHFQYCREKKIITKCFVCTGSNIYRGKIVVYIFSTTPWGTDAGRILVTKEFDAYDGVIEHGKNFELSIRVPSSEANLVN